METKLTVLCFIKHNFLTPGECDFLIDYHNTNSDLSNFEQSTDVFESKLKRSSFHAVIVEPKTEHFLFIKKKIRDALIEYGKYIESIGLYNNLFLSFFQFSHLYRILKYEEGSKIHPHLDHSTGKYGSVTFNLNDDYKGGEFTFFNKKFTPELKRGSLMVFPADIYWTHEVLPVTEGTRYSMNTFVQNNPDEINQNLQKNYIEPQLTNYFNSKDSNEILGPYFKERLSFYKEKTSY